MNELVPTTTTTTAITTEQQADRNPAAVYLASLGSEKSRRSMLNALRIVCNHALGGADALQVRWQDMRYQHVAAIRSKLISHGLAPATVNLALAALRGVAREAFALGLMTAEDYQRIRSVKTVRGERLPAGRSLAAGELAALMDACASDARPAGVRDAAIIAVLYAAGLRRSEITALDVDDYTPATGELVVRGKGNKQRLVYLTNGAAAALGDWLALRGDEPGALFCPINKAGRITHRRLADQAVYGMLRRRADQAGVREFSPHDLRRTFVGDLLDAGADISTVQKLAGHASVTTTQRYDRRPEAAKRRAVELLHIPYRSRGLGLGVAAS